MQKKSRKIVTKNEQKWENTPRYVIRGVNSQNDNETGIHWLRISFPRRYLRNVQEYLTLFFGVYDHDGMGLWSYTDKFLWSNGASLNFDNDSERAKLVHQDKITLDCPGQCLDNMASDELQDFVIGLKTFSPVCTRIDVFFDDYQRLINPADLNDIVKKGDYSGFQLASVKYTYRRGKRLELPKKDRDEVSFGKRGEQGSGKYLRVYDKNLESGGLKNCVRWECEFSKERAKLVFEKLSNTDNPADFAVLCGSIIAGVITFLHRKPSEKNIDRLDIYDFWNEILKRLGGKISIRVKDELNSYQGVICWVRKQVSPSLACLRKTFVDDVDFFNWLIAVVDDGDERMNRRLQDIAKHNKRNLRYHYEDEGFEL